MPPKVKKKVLPPGGYVGGRPKDTSKLSDNPINVRGRLRRMARRAQVTGDDEEFQMELAKYQAVTGFKPVEEWDLEELAHGKPRNKSGNFVGRTPTWITPEVTREAKKRLYNHAYGQLGANVDVAIKTVMNLMVDDSTDEKGKPIVDARTKLDAAKFIIEHIVGKPTTVLEVNATDSARQMFAAAIILDDGLPQGHLMADARTIEGEIAEDPDLNDEPEEMDFEPA